MVALAAQNTNGLFCEALSALFKAISKLRFL